MVSPPSKLKLFTGNVFVLLTSVSLKLSFRSPAEKKQTNKHSSEKKGWSGLFYPPNGLNFQFCWFNLIFWLLRVDPSPILFYFYFLFDPSWSESIRVDPVRLLYLPKIKALFTLYQTAFYLPCHKNHTRQGVCSHTKMELCWHDFCDKAKLCHAGL